MLNIIFSDDIPDDRFYTLRTVEQVYDHARMVVGNAEEIVLFDLFPGPLHVLQSALEQAAQRGVAVGGIAYGDWQEIRGLQICDHPWELAFHNWPGLQVTLVADARECLIALLTEDGRGVRHALRTDSAYLSCVHHSGLACEIQVAARKRERSGPIGLLRTPPAGLRKLKKDVAALECTQKELVRRIPGEGLANVLHWLDSNSSLPLSVADLAKRAKMSPRTFARQFRRQTGTTPHRWLTQLRLLAAQQRLEQTNDSMDRVAEAVGWQTAATLRQHFIAHVGTNPTSYRRRATVGQDNYSGSPSRLLRLPRSEQRQLQGLR